MKPARTTRDSFGSDYLILKSELAALGVHPRVGEELAHHLAKIKPEIENVAKILRKVCDDGRCSAEELLRLKSLIEFHWPYHVRRIDKLLQTIDESVLKGNPKIKRPLIIRSQRKGVSS